MVRPQRGVWAALSVSRLEIRRNRPVHRAAVGARGKRLRAQDQAALLSLGRARRGALDLYGAARAPAAAAGMGICDGQTRAALRVQALAGIQLAASDGGRHRFKPRVLATP